MNDKHTLGNDIFEHYKKEGRIFERGNGGIATSASGLLAMTPFIRHCERSEAISLFTSCRTRTIFLNKIEQAEIVQPPELQRETSHGPRQN